MINSGKVKPRRDTTTAPALFSYYRYFLNGINVLERINEIMPEASNRARLKQERNLVKRIENLNEKGKEEMTAFLKHFENHTDSDDEPPFVSLIRK